MSVARRAVRVLRAIGLGLLALVVLAVALVAGLVAHLDTAPARRLATAQLPGLLEGEFPGRVEIHELGSLSLSGLGGLDADLVHPDGTRVAALRGVSAGVDTWRTLKSLTGDGPIEVPIDEIAIDTIDIDVTSRGGSFRIAEVFEDPLAPIEPEDPDAAALDLRIARVTVKHVWAHGQIDAGGPVVDADVDDLRGAFATTPDATSIFLEHADVTTRQAPMGADLEARVSGALTLPEEFLSDRPDLGAFFAVTGKVAGSPLSAIGLVWGRAVHAMVSLPGITPEQIRRVVPDAPPVRDPVAVSASVFGTFDRLRGSALLLAGASRLDVDADVTMEPDLVARAHVRGRSLDAALVGGPQSSLSLTADGEVSMAEGQEPRGQVRLATEPGSASGVAIPAVVAAAHFVGERASGKAEIHEPGVRTDVTFAMVPGAKGPVIDAQLDAPKVELAKLHQRGVDARGTLAVSARGRVDLGEEHLVASARVTGVGLSSPMTGDASISSLELDARAQGALTRPAIHASLLAREIRLGQKRIAWATVQAAGDAMHPAVTAEVMSVDFPRVKARTRLHLEPGIALEDTAVDASRGTTTARAHIARIDIGSGMPALRDLTVDGLGERLTASVVPTPAGGTHVTAHAARLSIPAIAELAGVDTGISHGDLALDADLKLERASMDGSLAIDVDDLDARRPGIRLEKLDAHLRGTFDVRTVTFDFATESAKLGRVRLSSRRPVELMGPPTDARSWKNALGQVAVDADLDLAAVALLLPPGTLPVADIGGKLAVIGHVDRAARGAAPTCALAVQTAKLSVVGKPKSPPPGTLPAVRPDPNPANTTLTAAAVRNERRDAKPGPAKPTLIVPDKPEPTRAGGLRVDPTPVPGPSLRGVDLALNAACEADPQRITLVATARDVRGDLVVVDLRSDLAYARLLGGSADLRWLEDAPFDLHIAVPSRELRHLPRALGVPSMAGSVVGDLRVKGPLRQPQAELDAALVQLSIEKSPLEEPFGTKLLVRYDGTRVDARIAIDQSERRLLAGKAEAQLAIADVLRPTAGRPLPWTASADIEVGPLPLEILQAVMPAKIEGIASGRIKLDRLNQDAGLDVDLKVDGLVLGGIPHRLAQVKVKAAGELLEGTVRLGQPRGSLEADAKVGIAWGNRIAPEVRPDRRFDVDLRAKTFRLRAAEPFLTATFNQLDGLLDGSVHVSEEAITAAAQGKGVTGKLALTRGRVELAAAGGQLEDVRATVRLDDRGVLRLEDVYARGQTGEVRAVGHAIFGGGGFRSAKLNVAIPNRKPMPILIGGEHLGDVSGKVLAAAGWADGGRELRVDIDIPKMEISIPDRMPDGVQKLDEIERARIGTVRRGRFIPLPLDAPDPVVAAERSSFRTRLEVILRDATILRGDMLKTKIVGRPVLFMEDGRTRMSGKVEFRGGRVDIKGRLFEIESGTITFGDDPANPDVILTAKWEAPDGTTVFADFAGPVKTGKVTLRSNPPRSREEIIALVVFGRVEGFQGGGEQADTGTQAVGAAGGFATQGLNKALDDITSLEIRTRVDTSSSTNPKPELEMQISEEIAVKVSYLLGEIAPGQAADKTFATVDWNFQPQWSLETTVGDKASTTVDMIWEHMY